MSRRSTTGCSGQAILGRFPRKKRCLLPANTLRIGSFLLWVLSSPAHGEYPLSKGDLGVAGRPVGLFGWPSRLGREVGGPLPPRALLGCIKWRFGSYNTNRTLEYCAVPYTLHLLSLRRLSQGHVTPEQLPTFSAAATDSHPLPGLARKQYRSYLQIPIKPLYLCHLLFMAWGRG